MEFARWVKCFLCICTSSVRVFRLQLDDTMPGASNTDIAEHRQVVMRDEVSL